MARFTTLLPLLVIRNIAFSRQFEVAAVRIVKLIFVI